MVEKKVSSCIFINVQYIVYYISTKLNIEYHCFLLEGPVI